MTDIKIGDEVGWKWGNGLATGEVIAISYEKTVVTSKGVRITRNGTQDDPAVTIAHKNGNPVLKLAHELQVIKAS